MTLRRHAAALWWIATLAVALLGVASAWRFVGAEALAARSPGLPIAHDDYALQFYYGQLGAQLLRETGLPWGFDPRFLAGYPKNPLYYPSSLPFELALAVFAHADPVRVFNRCVFALLAALPFLAWGAAALLGLPRAERLLVTGFSLLPYRLAPSADFAPFLEASGMLAFVFAASFAAFALGLLHRAQTRRGFGTSAALGAAGALLCWLHPTAGLLLLAPAAAAYAGSARGLGLRGHLALAAIAAVLALATAPLLIGLARYASSSELGDFYTPAGREHFAPPGGLFAPLRISLPPPLWLALVPPIGGLAGLWLWWRAGQRALCAMLGSQVLFLFALAYYGAPLGLSALGPARLTLPLGQALWFPAAHALARALAWLWRRCGLGRSAAQARARRAALLAAAAALAFGSGLHARPARHISLPQLERESGFEARAAGLLAFLHSHAEPGSRLLHEETERLHHRYYGSHLAALFPGWTGALLAGGPAPHALVRQNTLRFIAGSWRGRRLAAVSDAELRRDFDLYNVGRVLCFSAAARQRFSALSWLERIGSYDHFALYRSRLPPSWFLQGQGQLEVQGRRVRLRALAPEDGAVALKLQWLETLRSEPPRRLAPHPVAGVPEAFLRVLDPPGELWIGEPP